MRIIYLNAQHLPATEVDSQQVVKTVSALAAEGADIELTVPRPLTWRCQTDRQLNEAIFRYYSIQYPFKLRRVPTIMRTPGEIERGIAAVMAAVTVRSRSYDILYIRNYLCALSAYALGLSFVLESHRLLKRHYPRRARMIRHMNEKGRIKGVVTNGNLITETFHSLGFPPERVLTAHNGFDSEDLEPVRSRREAREALGLDLREHIVFYGGHLQPHKGVDIFVELARQNPDIKFLLAGGTATDLEWFRSLMGPYNLRNLDLLGWKPPAALVNYLYAADILIIPPSSAPFRDYGRTTYPMKLYGYLAAGRPIVAPDTPDIAEVIKDGETGLLVEPDSPRQTAAAIRRILTDSAFAKHISAAAKEEAQQFTWRRRARRILSFLQELQSTRTVSEGLR